MSDSRYMNTLDKIQNHLERLSKSERKVAEVILASPQTAIHSSIATLARMADVSEPTVNRFCRRLDTKGFPDFKLHLAQSLANGTPYVNRNVEEDDSVDSYTSKIFESVMASLDTVKANLDIAAINRAVDLLTQAKKISFFGLGASAAVAHDAMNKFFRFNIPVVYFDDIVMQRMSCMNSGEGDVVVLISHTGRTKNLVEMAHLARENDATVLAITSRFPWCCCVSCPSSLQGLFSPYPPSRTPLPALNKLLEFPSIRHQASTPFAH